MMPLLADGFSEVVWLDSDLIVNGDLDGLLDNVASGNLVIAQDCRATVVGEFSIESRAHAWGFKVSRQLPYTLNSCILRVSREHEPLLEDWKTLLDSDSYKKEASLPVFQRRVGFVSDQEVLCALLAGERYSHLPLRVLMNGPEVLHSAGPRSLSPLVRLRAVLHGPPLIIHATTGKPWVILGSGYKAAGRDAVTRLGQELSPYTILARGYTGDLEMRDRGWLDHRTGLGRAIALSGFGNPFLSGIPLSLIASGVHLIQRLKYRLSSGR